MLLTPSGILIVAFQNPNNLESECAESSFEFDQLSVIINDYLEIF